MVPSTYGRLLNIETLSSGPDTCILGILLFCHQTLGIPGVTGMVCHGLDRSLYYPSRHYPSTRCSSWQILYPIPNGSDLDRIAIGSMHPGLLGDWMSAVPVVSK